MMSLGVVIMVALWRTDVYVPERGNSDGPSFCGSAYDVILFKRDGYMGGEMPPNQDAIDRACHEKSLGPVREGAVAGVTGLALGGLVVVIGGRRSRSEGRP